MKCKNANKNLVLYIENALPDDKEREMKEHLGTCKECSILMKELSESYETLNIKEVIEPKAFFAESVLGRISGNEAGKKEFIGSPLFDNIFSKYFREVIYSAAVILIILAAIFYLSESNLSLIPENDLFTEDDISIMNLDN